MLTPLPSDFVYSRGPESSPVPRELRHLISPFPDVRARYPRFGGLGDATTTTANVVTAAAQGNKGTTVGGSAATGAGVGASFGPWGAIIGGVVGAVVGLVGGGGTPDQMKNIWDVVPFSLLRLSGGHGTWTDTLTGQTLTDAQSDLRKSAVVASAIGAFNDSRNWWFDATTQQYLSGAQALQRWQQRFGALDFATAYSQYPTAFQTFGPNPQGDPTPHSPNASVAAVNPAPTTGPYGAPAATVTGAPLQASLLGNVSPTTLLIGAGLLVGLLLLNRKSSSGGVA